MSTWRLITLGALVVAPALALIAAGSWYFWTENLWPYVWWPFAACLGIAYFLGWHWQRQTRLLPPVEFAPQMHWTERDQQAWRLVEERAKAAKSIPVDRFTKLPFYVEVAQSMAEELARFYRPSATDPVESLTIPEILAVTELAAHDLSEMVDKYLPGGHLLTVGNWRRASQIPDWYNKASNVWWAISALFSPVNTAIRYTASQLGMSRPFQLLQANVLAWFYTAYIQRVGTYLIDLDSGRLRVGAKRYRELMEQAKRTESDTRPTAPREPLPGDPVMAAESPPFPQAITLVVLGQVKAGKSSLINALLGERRAATDVLPTTNTITQYRLRSPILGEELVLLDTVGYGHDGPKADQLAATHDALQQADLALLVMHARDPARQPDLIQLKELREWFGAHPHLKKPRVLGVVTHIDLLPPLMDWSPPYQWLEPQRPKEKSIGQALHVVREQLGEYLVGVLPVCAAPGRVFGIQEALLPQIVEQLDEARGVGLLRCLFAEADAHRIRKVFDQALQAGRQLVRAALGK
jgi:predicted GTPase